LPFELPAFALVRAVAPRFDACLREHTEPPIDVEAARLQHAAYVAILRGLGIQIELVEANDAHADGCFVEDTAVVTGARAVLTIPGAPSRRAETREVLPVLARHCQVQVMEGDARLDGGDVLRVNGMLFVGLSSRTNQAGIDLLASVAAEDGLETRTVPLSAGLHLKSVCTFLDPSTVVCAPSLAREAMDILHASGCELLEVPEAPGANVLALGDVILVSIAAPLTVALLRARGKQVVLVDVREMHKADGALTCLSIRIPRPGHWSA